MRRLLNLKNNEKGQSMVEFAIVLPILIALVVGIIQFGLIFNVKITLANQARDTVRLIAVGSLSDDNKVVDEFVRDSLKKNSLISKYTEGTKMSVTTTSGVQATVTITIPKFDLMVVKNTASLSGQATMRVEPGSVSGCSAGHKSRDVEGVKLPATSIKDKMKDLEKHIKDFIKSVEKPLEILKKSDFKKDMVKEIDKVKKAEADLRASGVENIYKEVKEEYLEEYDLALELFDLLACY